MPKWEPGLKACGLQKEQGKGFFRPPCTHVDKACALTFSLSVLTCRCAVGHLKEQFSRGESGTPTKTCRDPGSNWGPPDLQSDALPTELSRHWLKSWLELCSDCDAACRRRLRGLQGSASLVWQQRHGNANACAHIAERGFDPRTFGL